MTNAAKKLVHGIEEGKLSEEAVDAGLSAVDIHPAEGMALKGKVELLVEHFRTLATADLADCDNCGAPSAVALPCCPFCGEGGDIKPARAAKKAEKEAGKAAAAEAKKAPAVPRQSPEAAALTTPPEAKIPQGALAAQARPEKTATIALLDKDVAEVRALDHEMNGYNWRLAQKLVEIAESQRWKLRMTAENKTAYRTFEEFANAELDITREYAELLMRIAKRFSESEVVQLGPTKLRVVLGAPPAQQAKVLQAFQQGKSRREVERELKPASKARDLGGAGKGKKDSKPAEKGKITIAVVEGRHTVKAFKKPEKRVAEDAEIPRAKRLADRPYGHMDLGNDTRLWIEAVVADNGEISFKVEFRRIEE